MSDSPRDRARSLLLAALDPTGKAWTEAVDALESDVDWDWLLDRARVHKLIGLLAARLSGSEAPEGRPGAPGPEIPEAADLEIGGPPGLEIPETTRREIQDELKKGQAHQAAISRTLEELRARLERLSCPFFMIKGMVFAHELYPDPAMRRFSDIDIVIPHKRLLDVDRTMKEAGYYFWVPDEIHRDLPRWFRDQAPREEEPGSEAAAWRILAAFHRHHLYVLQADDPRRHVEIHWHVFLPDHSRASSNDLWAQTRSILIDGEEVRTLDYEASLIHCAVHAMEQPPTEFRLLHLCDVAWMLWAWKDVLDSEKLQLLAREWGLANRVTAAIMALEQVLPSGLPEKSREIWPFRDSFRGGLLAAAGFGEWVVDRDFPQGRTALMLAQAGREALWEVAMGRPPKLAWGRVSRAFRARIPGSETRALKAQGKGG